MTLNHLYHVNKNFSYCFDSYNNEYQAKLKLNNINKNLFIKDKKRKKIQYIFK